MKWLTIFLFFISVGGFAQPKVKVDTLIDFTRKDSLSLRRELKIMQAVLDSPVFWELIIETNFYCRNQRRFHWGRNPFKSDYPIKKKDRHDYTNQEINDLIWNGDDEIGTPNDGIINLKLRAKHFEPNRNGTITHGSTNKNTLIISSSPTTRINNKTKGVYACHLLHEYMHVLGFKHKSNHPTKNKKKCGGVDVVLGIQQIAIKTYKHILKQKK